MGGREKTPRTKHGPLHRAQHVYAVRDLVLVVLQPEPANQARRVSILTSPLGRGRGRHPRFFGRSGSSSTSKSGGDGSDGGVVQGLSRARATELQVLIWIEGDGVGATVSRGARVAGIAMGDDVARKIEWPLGVEAGCVDGVKVSATISTTISATILT